MSSVSAPYACCHDKFEWFDDSIAVCRGCWISQRAWRALSDAIESLKGHEMKTLKVHVGRGEPIPSRAHAHDAGIDLTASKRVWIEPGEVTVVPTGVRVAIPSGHVGLIMLRSSLAAGRALALANGVGVIDAGYRGEIGIPLATWEPSPERIEAGERIAQLLVVPIVTPAVEWVDELPPSEDGRGTGGFGSTGR